MPKARLLAALAGKNRGISATETDRQTILAAIAELETCNPHPQPLKTAVDLLAGDWRLLYTSSQSLLGIDRLPLLELANIYQCIRPLSSSIYNIAEVSSLLPGTSGLVAIVADFTPITDARVNVRFKRSLIGFQGLFNYSDPERLIAAIENGQKFPAIDLKIDRPNKTPAWLDITYLDHTLRIGRGNEGNVFVLAKD
jgi:PAP_fibrillin